jgi:hypothetical protein
MMFVESKRAFGGSISSSVRVPKTASHFDDCIGNGSVPETDHCKGCRSPRTGKRTLVIFVSSLENQVPAKGSRTTRRAATTPLSSCEQPRS